MSQNVMSQQSSRRGAAERQRRWRARQRVKRQTEDRLRHRLGRAPTAAEMRDEIEAQLGALGLGSGPACVSDDRDTGVPADASLEAMLPDGGGADGDHDDTHINDSLPSSPAIAKRPRLAERRPLPADPARADGTDAGRGVALASVSFELRIAAERDKIYDMLMRRAEEGDVSCLLFLGSRLAPPARPRRIISVPELASCNLSTSDGVQHGI